MYFTVNFLFDKSQTPHMRADELCAAFGVSQSSGSNKAKFIRDLFGMFRIRFSRRSMGTPSSPPGAACRSGRRPP